MCKNTRLNCFVLVRTENSLVLATRGHVSVGLSREKMCIILFTFYIVEHLEEKQYVALALATTASSH